MISLIITITGIKLKKRYFATECVSILRKNKYWSKVKTVEDVST